MKSKRAWGIYKGGYYRDGGFDCKAFRTKKSAEKYLRGRGFKFNKEEDLFLNDDYYQDGTNEGIWARVELMEFIDE